MIDPNNSRKYSVNTVIDDCIYNVLAPLTPTLSPRGEGIENIDKTV